MLSTVETTYKARPMSDAIPQQKRIAISYRRWSSAIQNTGDSERRQAEMAREWCAANGFELDDRRSIVDAGISAFRGQNLGDESKLAKLLEAVKLGDIPRHATILIKQFDRLSMAAASEAQRQGREHDTEHARGACALPSVPWLDAARHEVEDLPLSRLLQGAGRCGLHLSCCEAGRG